MGSEIVVRAPQTLDEFRACHEVQRATWAFDDLLIIPYTQLVSAHHHGGAVLGAFDGGTLVGFVFGYLARQGQDAPYLFSQRMGVRPEYQGRGIGERLKWAQCDWALARGLDRVVWTYDPLEAPNARLNLHKLGGVVRRYQRDLYGQHDTPLHGGLASDRFVVDWHLAGERVRACRAGQAPAAQVGAPLNKVRRWADGLPRSDAPDLARADRLLLARVPAAWQALRRADMGLAREWRAQTRLLFEHYLGQGYAVTGYVRGEGGPDLCNYYVLEQPPGDKVAGLQSSAP